MRVRVLGAYGAPYFEKKAAGGGRGYRSSCFQVNQTVLLDGGSIGGALDIDEMAQLRYVFLSHAHLDHTHGLPFMTENVFGKVKQPIVIASTEDVLDDLRKHLFNDHIWPDFSVIPSRSNPIIRYEPMKVGHPVSVEGITVTAVRVNHTVPTVGFLVNDDHSAIIYSGDTWKTDEIWDRASRMDHLKAAFIESSFPNRFGQLAYDARHLTPALTYEEFLKIRQKDISLYTYHMKIPYLDEMKKELLALPNKRIHIVEDGQIMEF